MHPAQSPYLPPSTLHARDLHDAGTDSVRVLAAAEVAVAVVVVVGVAVGGAVETAVRQRLLKPSQDRLAAPRLLLARRMHSTS